MMIGGDIPIVVRLVYVAAELLGQASDHGDGVRSLADLVVHLQHEMKEHARGGQDRRR